MTARLTSADAAGPHAGPTDTGRRWTVGVVVCVAALLGGGCAAFSDAESTDSTIDVDRENREEGDVEGNVGDSLEVYGIEATVLEVTRVDSYSELDSRGYIQATVQMENTSGQSFDYDRSDWRLEKPDGSTVNTANVSTEPQILDDTLPAGATQEGTVIYTAGDEEGQFAIVFSPADLRPDDPLAVERGVWVFESSPEDAG